MPETLDALKTKLRKETAKKNRLDLSLALKKEKERKAIISQKIKLGTLIFELNLQQENEETIRGILQEAQKKLTSKEAEKYRKKWQDLSRKVAKKEEKPADFD